MMASRIHFNLWENILISRLYVQFSQNDSAMAPENINISYIALDHLIWRFRICNYFCEISKCRNFMNTLINLVKSVSSHISAKLTYFAKKIILTGSPDHVL